MEVTGRGDLRKRTIPVTGTRWSPVQTGMIILGTEKDSNTKPAQDRRMP